MSIKSKIRDKKMELNKHKLAATLTEYWKNLLIVLAVLVIFTPIFWMFSSAFRPESGLYGNPTIIPHTLTISNFSKLFTERNFGRYYINSIIYVLGVVILTVIAATLGGYGLARLEVRGKKWFARTVLFGYMFPGILLAIPMYLFWRQLGILNTHIGIILAETARALPFTLWLMWQYFQTIPYSLEESAEMAGASRIRALWEVVIPMAKPGMIAVGVFAYAISWDNYTIPQVLLSDKSFWPVTVGLATLREGAALLWPQIMAASAITIIPSFIFIYTFQNYLLSGFRIE